MPNRNKILWTLLHTLVVTLFLYCIIPILALDPLDEIASVKSTDKSTEMEMSDLYHIIYANRERETYCPDIKLIYIDDCADREEIASVISTINKLEPRVVGVDLIFPTPTDFVKDSILLNSLRLSDNIVMSCVLDNSGNGECFNDKYSSFFQDSLTLSEGYINLEGSGGQSIIRNYKPFLFYNSEQGTDTIYSFASHIIHCIAPDHFEKLKVNDGKPELINFKLLRFDSYMSKDTEAYAEEVRGNVVILGSRLGDWHNTPISPQMEGVVIHAYTVATILYDQEITQVYNWWTKVFTFIITYLFTLVCFVIMSRIIEGASAIIRILQFLLLALLVYFGYAFFIYGNKNFYCTQLLFAVTFASLAIDIYMGLLSLAKKVRIPVKARITKFLVVRRTNGKKEDIEGEINKDNNIEYEEELDN